MTIQFYGGPYDGMVLDSFDVEKLDTLLQFSTKKGLRRFVFLPDLSDWPAVMSSQAIVRDSDRFYYYEFVATWRGVEYQFDPDALGFREAVMESR